MIRITLWATVVFNLVAAYILLYPAGLAGDLLAMPLQAPAVYRVFSAYLVFAFGCAYAWMALQPEICKPLLRFAAYVKAGAFAVIWSMWFAGAASTGVALLAIGDIIFAAIWFNWLRDQAK